MNPRRITTVSSVMCRTTARSWPTKTSATPVSRRISPRRPRICAWIDTSSAATASSSDEDARVDGEGTGDGQPPALPPDSSCGRASASLALTTLDETRAVEHSHQLTVLREQLLAQKEPRTRRAT